MKHDLRTHSTLRQLFSLALAASLAFPLAAPAASITLATSPLATSTTSTVLPNLMFILDDSGSMSWTFMPDVANDFHAKYGYQSSQCNGVYFDPNVTYLPPVDATGVSFTDASFTAARDNGFDSASTARNLDSAFIANRFSPDSANTTYRNWRSYLNNSGADSLGPYAAHYYTYSGSQTVKNFNNSSSTFYTECNSSFGVIPGNGSNLFTKVSLSSSAAATTATIVVSGSSSTSVSGIKVNNTQEIMSGTAAASATSSTVAANIAAQINLCTGAMVGNCTSAGGHGYTATASSSTVTITGLAATATALIITKGNTGTMTLSPTIFPVADAAKLTNFANWYSFYRTRMQMMKTAAGRAYKTLDSHYRTGFMRINSSGTPALYLDTFESAHRTDWYSTLYNSTPNGGTPLREALANSGRYYAGKLSGADPVQYSCQQNFTILSTDGFWNGNEGFKVNGSTSVGNQDGLAPRPMYDGGLADVTTSQVRETKTQVTQETSTLQGTLSKVLMRCNNTSAVCGTAPATGLADANWSVVASGTCTPAASVQCSIVSGLSGASAVATRCNTAATISSSAGTGIATVTITNSSNAVVNRVRGNGSNGTDLLSGNTAASSVNDDVASAIATKINNCTSGTTGNCDVSGHSATVSGNVVTVTGPNVTSGFSVSLSSGSATRTISYAAGPSAYTLNNADSNGKIYSSCVYSAWSAPAVAASCANVNQSATPNNTTVVTAKRCTTNTTQAATLVGSCTAGNSGAPSYTQTTCTPTTTTVYNQTSCPAQTASAANSWTTITCSSTGGTSDTLADVAMYYYQTDLRTAALTNCQGALGVGVDVCPNDVFKTDTDNNVTQHMSTFTLGLGASGRMNYSPSYLTDTGGDYYSVKLGSTASAAPSTISVSGTGSTSVSGITVNGVQLMSGTSTASTSTSTVAANIATKITQNGFSATASGSTVTITGPASAAYYTPVITQSGAMTLTPEANSPVCSWQANGTTCNWPIPGDGNIENIDDLWHAAVDGHGTYFSATSPASLSSGLASALAAIAARKGSSAAAATSTLNPVAGNNFAYVASYTTVKWQGNLEARTIDVNTGVISEAASWCVESLVAGTCSSPSVVVADTSGASTVFNCVTSGSTAATCLAPEVFDAATSECKLQMATACTGTMPGKVGTISDTRTIYTADSTGTALVAFDDAYATANPANFSAAHINTLSQWASLTAAQRTAAEGVNLINFLRGQSGFEDRAINLVGAVDNRLYRYRESTLGDALESQPVFIANPVFSYVDPGYSDYATAQAGRVGTVYMGTNDGMLHAFSALDEGSVSGGTERWAYVPSMVIPNMWKLADKDYATLHANFVNGSPIISDICPKTPPATCNGSEWKTILVGGLNAGGRGYFALDVTDPATPILLWEFSTADDSDLGYSFGNPVITAKSDGTWVVLLTSGYNNSSPGNGQGYLYVLNAGTGAVISKIGTGAGDTTTPSGLAKISAWSDEPASNRATYVYGGDLLGNVWRFDINTAGTPLLFATLLDPSGNPQPVTTAPVLGKIVGKRVIFVGTGKYLETSDLTDTQVHSLYAIKDDNAVATLVNPGGSPRNSTTLVQQTLTLGTGNRTASSNAVNFNTGRGWYVDFPDSGERSNIESRLVQGTLLVATIVPSNTVCSPGGYGWLNFFDYLSGGPVDTSGVVSVRYDSTIVGINVLYIDGNPIIEAVTSNNPTPQTNEDVLFQGVPSGFTGKRVLWRELNP